MLVAIFLFSVFIKSAILVSSLVVKSSPSVVIYPNIEKLGSALCREVEQCYAQAIAEKGKFNFAIPGGSM